MAMHNILCVSSFVLCLLVIETAPAQAVPPSAAPASGAAPAPTVSVSPEYRLGPGDVLEVVVPTHEGFNSTLTIQPDGRIYYPFVGGIMVTGLTIPELTTRIREGLEKDLRGPQVTISMREVRPGSNSRVTIMGAVRSETAVDLRENWRVSDAIAAAGGATDKADLKRVTFWHQGKPMTLDLTPLLVDGRLDQNPALAAGDVLVIPERPRLTVSITGEGVHNQGSFEMDDPEPTVLKALQKAGGYTERADLKRAQIMRAGHPPAPLDLEALLLHGNMALNLPLGNGDTVQVPVMEDKVFVFGEVNRPDTVPLKPGTRVLDALSAASPTHEANLDKAVLIRKQPNGQPAAQQLHLGRLQKGDLSVNVLLQSGDVLLIPTKGRKLGIPDMLQILYPVQILQTLIRGY
jgi:polysaccharide biosynthesis/export protein